MRPTLLPKQRRCQSEYVRKAGHGGNNMVEATGRD